VALAPLALTTFFISRWISLPLSLLYVLVFVLVRPRPAKRWPLAMSLVVLFLSAMMLFNG
jgi:hypothetical protein